MIFENVVLIIEIKLSIIRTIPALYMGFCPVGLFNRFHPLNCWMAPWSSFGFLCIVNPSCITSHCFIMSPVCDACYQVTAKRFLLLAHFTLFIDVRAFFHPLNYVVCLISNWRSLREHKIKEDATAKYHKPWCPFLKIVLHWC